MRKGEKKPWVRKVNTFLFSFISQDFVVGIFFTNGALQKVLYIDFFNTQNLHSKLK